MSRLLATIVVVPLLAACGSSGTDQPPAPQAVESTGQAFLRLSGVATSEDLAVTVSFTPSPTAPRMADLRLGTTVPLTLLGTTRGAAAEAAGKELVVKPIAGGYRVIVMSSSNVATLGAGELFTLRFVRPDTSPVTFALLAEAPLLAPAGAEKGLELGDPLTL